MTFINKTRLYMYMYMYILTYVYVGHMFAINFFPFIVRHHKICKKITYLLFMVALACERDFKFYPYFLKCNFHVTGHVCGTGMMFVIINCNKFYLIMLTFVTKLDALVSNPIKSSYTARFFFVLDEKQFKRLFY